jgi:hypothetical protein
MNMKYSTINMKPNRLFLLVFWLCPGLASTAQVKTLLVRPWKTDTALLEIHGPHIALYDTTAEPRRELVLMIEGTGAPALGCRKFDSCFARMGYHTISLDYLNEVVTTVCSDSPDSACFDSFRQEIVFGTPVSDKVKVDSTNSIVRRFTRLLNWLTENDPQGGWNAWLNGDQPRWEHIVVAGHSQGAGHAAYLGKVYNLAGVIMLSGPQDYLKQFNRPAPWQSLPGQTPPEKQYAFLNLRDPYNYAFQVADVAKVTGFPLTDTTMVQPGTPVTGGRHIFVNDLDTEDHHGSTMNLVFVPVWEYIMRRLNDASLNSSR